MFKTFSRETEIKQIKPSVKISNKLPKKIRLMKEAKAEVDAQAKAKADAEATAAERKRRIFGPYAPTGAGRPLTPAEEELFYEDYFVEEKTPAEEIREIETAMRLCGTDAVIKDDIVLSKEDFADMRRNIKSGELSSWRGKIICCLGRIPGELSSRKDEEEVLRRTNLFFISFQDEKNRLRLSPLFEES